MFPGGCPDLATQHASLQWVPSPPHRVSSEFRKQGQDLMSQGLTDPVPHILYQRLADILFKKSLEERVTVLNAQECDIEPLTRIEENALRYAAGYTVKKRVLPQHT